MKEKCSCSFYAETIFERNKYLNELVFQKIIKDSGSLDFF